MTASSTSAREDRVAAAGHQLAAVLLQFEMHGETSTPVLDSLTMLASELAALARASQSSGLRFEVDDAALRHAGKPLLSASLQAGRLLRQCKQRRIVALRFDPEVDAEQLRGFLHWLGDEHAPPAPTHLVLRQALGRHGVKHVHPELDNEAHVVGPTIRVEAAGSLAQYQAIADVLQDNHVAAFRGEGVELDATAGVVEQTISQMTLEPSGLLALASYDDIDSFTVGHSVRVTLLALQVASHAGASRHDLLRVGIAALLHDIGKSRIPQQILFKPGRLTAEERTVMMQHARLGGEILLEQGGVDPTAIGAAFCHHMAQNRSGYPEPALQFEPSGLSKLVRVCDVFEALTAVRPYKTALTPVQAYVIMHRMRDGFDPRWLRFFTRCLGIYPIGTRLVLDDGSPAVVVAPGPTIHQPLVRLAGEDQASVTIGIGEPSSRREIRAVVGAGTVVEIPSPPPQSQDPECGCDLGVRQEKAQLSQ